MRILKLGVGKSENMAKSGYKSPTKKRPVLIPRRVARSEIDVQTIDAHPKIQKYAHGIVHGRAARGHNAMLNTRSQNDMVGILSWEIIRHHDMWIYAQEVDIEGYSKAGRRLKLVGARGVMKNCLGVKR